MASLSPGQSFGRYEIKGLLGEGGMGEVYRARDTKLRRNVALKVIHPDHQAERGLTYGIMSRFTREAQAVAALAHANVVTVFDIGEVDGTPFIAMELLDGATLRSLILKPTTIAQRLRWLLETARALAAAHALGLVHRDIKPDNIMICSGHVKVLDFGVAKWVDDAAGTEVPPRSDPLPSQRTAAGVAIGTPRYMAPEQTRGRAVDATADQFAWGVVAYEILARAHPQDRSPAFTREKDWGAPPTPLAELVPELPFGVSAIVMKALSKWPSDRFESMTELIEALEPIVEQSPNDIIGDQDRTVDPNAITVEDERFSRAITPLPEPPRARFELGLVPVIVLAVAAVAATAFITAPPARAPVRTIAVTPNNAPPVDADRVDVAIDFLPLRVPADPAIDKALRDTRLETRCFDKDFGRAYLRGVDSSAMRLTLAHAPSGFITSATAGGLSGHDDLRNCIESTLMQAQLPSTVPGTELFVTMKLTPKHVPPPRNPPPALDESKAKFALAVQIVGEKHYDRGTIEKAFAPVSAQIVECRRFEKWAEAKNGLLFNVVLTFDRAGKLEKRIVEAPDSTVWFNDCVNAGLKSLVLPAPKGNVAGTIKVTMIISPSGK